MKTLTVCSLPFWQPTLARTSSFSFMKMIRFFTPEAIIWSAGMPGSSWPKVPATSADGRL